MSKELELKIYDASIPAGEHRSVRAAIEAAHKDRTVTYVTAYPGQRAAIVPEAAALWWEAHQAGLCPMCVSSWHTRCFRYVGQPCNCVNADVHDEHEMARSVEAGLLTWGTR